jgi:hypothetical protein
MIKLSLAATLVLTLTAACSSSGTAPHEIAQRTAIGFDKDGVGSVPSGWQVGSTTPAAADATWAVRADADAPSKPNVLALTAVNHSSQDTYNLCWTSKIGFRDGTIEVAVKPGDGEIDQGGGVIWRVQGPNDYYLCRYNPLESNFRVYVVKGGARTQLDTALAGKDTGGWHRIRIEHSGKHIHCTLNGADVLDVEDDALPGVGGVGLWTKADARTAFDDLRITPEGP